MPVTAPLTAVLRRITLFNGRDVPYRMGEKRWTAGRSSGPVWPASASRRPGRSRALSHARTRLAAGSCSTTGSGCRPSGRPGWPRSLRRRSRRPTSPRRRPSSRSTSAGSSSSMTSSSSRPRSDGLTTGPTTTRTTRSWSPTALGEGGGGTGCAMVFSDGVWYDPQDRLFKMWYMAARRGRPATRPPRTGSPGRSPRWTSRRAPTSSSPAAATPPPSGSTWRRSDPAKRYKMFRSCSGGEHRQGAYGLASSSRRTASTGANAAADRLVRRPHHGLLQPVPQGLGLQPPARLGPAAPPPLLGDRPTCSPGPKWDAISEPPLWCGADTLDPPRDDLQGHAGAVQPRLRRLREPDARACSRSGAASPTRPGEAERGAASATAATAGTGTGPTAAAFCPVSETRATGTTATCSRPAACCLVVGDQLYFYVSGRGGTGETGRGPAWSRPGHPPPRRLRLDGRRGRPGAR